MTSFRRSWKEGRVATLKDVARDAGVSESTVSVVLNGARSGTRVSEATRQTILATAERLGYRPNGLARSLQNGRSNRLGVYSGSAPLDARNMFFAELLGGMLEGSRGSESNITVHTTGNTSECLLDLVSNRSVDGLVVHAQPNDPILPILGELRVPAVAVADRLDTLPSVCVDDRAGGVLQAEHLAELGHRHVLVKADYRPFRSVEDRVSAFVERARALGLEVSIGRPATYDEPFDLGPEDLRLLTRAERPATAVVAWNDSEAERVCAQLEALGLDVPGRIGVVGFDGFHLSYRPYYGLTTVRAPWTEVGRVAVSVLMSLIKGEAVPAVTTLPVELVRGDTT